jgi:hypothetical protein
MSIPAIIEMYENGTRTIDIAQKANVSARHINAILKSNNAERRPRGSWLRKYTINEDYFKTWSNNMAYLLGFFVADGNMPQEAQMISYSQKDPEILKRIREELGSNHRITKNKNTGVHLLNLHSKIIKNDLIKIHGLTPNKSSSVEFPYVPDEYLSHFIRGYFDGDGNINYEKRVVTFVGGSIKYMEQLKSNLEKQSFKPYLTSKRNHYRLFLSGRRTVFLFGKWIYQNNSIHLPRKYQEFQKENLKLEDLYDRSKKFTKTAVQERKTKFLDVFRYKQDVDEVCELLKINQQTVLNWLKHDSEFKNKYKSIK